jgi:hypothetical protein
MLHYDSLSNYYSLSFGEGWGEAKMGNFCEIFSTQIIGYQSNCVIFFQAIY